MAGKKTYLIPGGHPSAKAQTVPPVSISDGEWKEIEHALGRELIVSERKWMQDAIELHRTFLRDSRASTQQVKESLAGLAALGPALALRAYHNADGWTQAEIASAMSRAGESLGSPTGAEIARYANEALRYGVTPHTRGDPTGMLAKVIWDWWDRLGGESCSASARIDRNHGGYYATPIVHFAAAIFAAADAPGGEVPAIASRLRRAHKRSGG